MTFRLSPLRHFYKRILWGLKAVVNFNFIIWHRGTLNNLIIRELTSEQDWEKAASVLRCLRRDLSVDQLLKSRVELINSGYRLFGISESERLITVAGVTVSPHLTRIKEFWVRDFVTIEEMQSKGYGVKMIDYLKNLAKSEGFNRICLYTQIGNKRSQNFYDNKVSFNKYGFMYVNDI